MFNTTQQLQHVTPLPPDIPPSALIDLLHGGLLIINGDPHMIKYVPIALPTPPPAVPADRLNAVALPPSDSSPLCYQVTDRVQTLPAGLWDSDVESTFAFVDTEQGVFSRMKSPLGIMMETVWSVREVEGKQGEWELLEDILISCSRLLMGTVKSTCEAGWQTVHQKMIEKLKESHQKESPQGP